MDDYPPPKENRTFYDYMTNPSNRENPIYTKREKLLLLISLVLSIIFSRIFFGTELSFFPRVGLFWLSYIFMFYLFNWTKIKSNKLLWVTNGLAALLALWYPIFSFVASPYDNVEFFYLTFLVLPAVLMVNTQWFRYNFSPNHFTGLPFSFIAGFFVDMFSGIPITFAVIGSLFSKKNFPVFSKVLIGLLISVGLMLFIIPMLMGADLLFQHYVLQFFGNIGFSAFFTQLIVIALSFMVIYSFMWNTSVAKVTPFAPAKEMTLDKIIAYIVLGNVILIYTLFCVIQFTYLFARAGLPEGLTFSEYARAGFAQTVIICGFNLLIFGVFLKFNAIKHYFIKFMLCLLLILTCIMLFSGGLRLSLYIEAFGFTWLRLLSAWFIIYLGVILVLAYIRLFTKKAMPLLVIAGVILLAWYVLLGYLNPHGFVTWYNTLHAFS